MQHFDRIGPAPRERPPSLYREMAYRPPSHIGRDGASLRMVAAMAEPFLPAARSLFEGEEAAARWLTPFAGEALESDAQYYRRRSKEEGRAAGEAAVPEARAAHQELADRYARLARRAMRSRGGVPSHHQAAGRSRVAAVLRRRFGLSAGGRARLRVQEASRPISFSLTGEQAVRSLVGLG